jgi:hypothetical protein
MLILSTHAREAVEKRELATSWIERTIASPDFRRVDPRHPSLTRSYKAIDEARGKILRVVHRPIGNDIIVVTAHFDRDARP